MRVIRVVCPLMSLFGRFLDYERRCVCVSILIFKEIRMTPIHLPQFFEQALTQPWQEVPIA
jgi:hypothetical protein